MIAGLAARLSPAHWRAAHQCALGRREFDAAHYEVAVEHFDRALALQPAQPDAHVGRGLALRRLQRHAEALASFDAVLALVPGHRDALYQRGNTLLAMGRPQDALRAYDAALKSKADDVDLLYNRGVALQALGRHEQAIGSYDQVLRLTPGDAQALNNRGNALMQLKRPGQALLSYQQALQAEPDHADALYNQSVAQLELKQPGDAAASLARLLDVAPGYPFAKGKLLHARMLACDWSDCGTPLVGLMEDIHLGKPVADPFGLMGLCDEPATLRRCAEIYTETFHPALPGPRRVAQRREGARIRIGYLSGEFRQQATSVLIAELIERHDRERFELFAFDNGWDDGSPMRRRLAAAFNEMVAIGPLGDAAAADAVAARGIDILVDLNGFFGLARQGVLAHRPSPLQLNYLGFPGTLGAGYVDYIVADRIVIPPDQARHYAEQVITLPDCYQPNDRRRVIATATPTRAELGLPESGFVFCCFNNNFKITPAIFDVWMRLLQQVPGSVLWLLKDNAAAADNLRAEAERRAVAADRLVLAPRMALPEHLARHRAADLFLDTLPCNAHTTASDALWAGLPLLTCLGGAFAGRVAASLLHAVGLPELVTHSLAEYEALALTLARDSQRLGALRHRLGGNLPGAPLFDSERHCRHLESAFETMRARALRGLAPAAFAVEAID